MNEPLITVAMPVYNAGKYLQPALTSILNQTYQNWELIIIDDGSTDGCFDGLPELNDKRVKLIRDGKNKGIAKRLNEAINLAKGEFFARMDGDDISKPQRLELQLNQLLSYPEFDLVATKVATIDQEGKVGGYLPFKHTHMEICAKPWLGFYMPHPSWMGKTAWFKKYLYATPAPFRCEDQDLLLRAYASSKFATLDQVLLFYRVSSYVNFQTLFKTRVSLLKCQLRVFWIRRNFLYFVAALTVVPLKILKDILSKLKSVHKCNLS